MAKSPQKNTSRTGVKKSVKKTATKKVAKKAVKKVSKTAKEELKTPKKKMNILPGRKNLNLDDIFESLRHSSKKATNSYLKSEFNSEKQRSGSDKLKNSIIPKTKPGKIKKTSALFETYGTRIKIEAEKGLQIEVSEIYQYKQYDGGQIVTDILKDIDEDVPSRAELKRIIDEIDYDGSSGSILKLNVSKPSARFFREYLKSKSNGDYFFDVIFENLDDEDQKNEYLEYLKSLLKLKKGSNQNNDEYKRNYDFIKNDIIGNVQDTFREYFYIIRFEQYVD